VIRYSLPGDVGRNDIPTYMVTLRVYNVLGQEVATLVNEEMKPGSYEVTWEAGGFSSGVYFYRLQAGRYAETKKLVLIR
ncbi:MAG: T9SS type A sorting domain-containing protein, partial [Bacteroidota bacterium]